MTALEAVLAAATAILGGGGALAGVAAWRGKARLREIARAEKQDALQSDAAKREDTAQHRVIDVLVARVESLESAERDCGERLLRAAEEAKAERHKLRDMLHAELLEVRGELAECREQHAESRVTIGTLDARLSMMERKTSEPKLPAVKP